MIDYIKIINQYPTGVLSSQNEDRLDSRIVRALSAQEGRIYFSTHGERSLYAQLQKNPNVTFCTYAPDYAPVLTLNGKVVFADDMELKTRLMEESDIVKRNYQTPDNPAFKPFYLEIEEVKSFSFADGTQRWEL